MDGRLYLDVNRFAVKTHWLHGFMTLYVNYLALVLGVILLAFAVVKALRADHEDRENAVSGLILTLIGLAVSFGVVELVIHLVNRPLPIVAFPNAEILVSRSALFSMPSLQTALFGALVAGLLISRRVVLGVLALIGGGLSGYACVYVGASYASDVIAGAGFGIVIVLLGLPVRNFAFELFGGRLEPGLHGSHLAGSAPVGPAVQQTPVGASTSVRVLSQASIRPQAPSGHNGGTQPRMPSS